VDVFVTSRPRAPRQRRGGEAKPDPSRSWYSRTRGPAIGTELVRTGKTSRATPVTVITLEVTPAEAEKLALASSSGKFPTGASQPAYQGCRPDQGATIDTLLSSYQGGDPGKNPREKPRSRAFSSSRARKLPLYPSEAASELLNEARIHIMRNQKHEGTAMKVTRLRRGAGRAARFGSRRSFRPWWPSRLARRSRTRPA